MDRLPRQSRTAMDPAATAGRSVSVYSRRSICSPAPTALARSVDRPCGFRLGQPRAFASSSHPSARLLETCSPVATPAVAAAGDSILRIVLDGLVSAQRPDKTALQRDYPRAGNGWPHSHRHDTSTGCSWLWGLIAPSPSHLGRVQRRVRSAVGCQLRAMPAASVDAGAARAATGPVRGNGQQGVSKKRIQGYVGRHGCLEGNRNTERGGGGDQFAPNVDGGATGRPRSFFSKANPNTSEPYPDLRSGGMLLCAAGGDVELAACPPALPPLRSALGASVRTALRPPREHTRPASFSRRSHLAERGTTVGLSFRIEDSPAMVHRDRNGHLSTRRNPALARRHQMGRRSAPPGTPHTRAGRSFDR